MKLHEHLSENTVCLELKSTEKTEAIAELADLLKGHPAVGDLEEFKGAVFAREMDSTTGIGGGVAIPHARTDSVRDFVAAVGRAKDGIDFNAVDGKPVRLILLMGIPAHRVKAYLKLLAHLSVLLKQPDFVQRVLDAPDAAAVVRTFAEYEGAV